LTFFITSMIAVQNGAGHMAEKLGAVLIGHLQTVSR
jgi:hypothetical protein